MAVTRLFAQSSGATNSFTIFQTDAGTSPTADSPNDTLTLTSSDGSVVITGDAGTDTIDFTVAGALSGFWLTSGNSGLVDGSTNLLGTLDTVPVRLIQDGDTRILLAPGSVDIFSTAGTAPTFTGAHLNVASHASVTTDPDTDVGPGLVLENFGALTNFDPASLSAQSGFALWPTVAGNLKLMEIAGGSSIEFSLSGTGGETYSFPGLAGTLLIDSSTVTLGTFNISGTATRIPFFNSSSGLLTSSANLVYSNASDFLRMGLSTIGNTAAKTQLHATATAQVPLSVANVAGSALDIAQFHRGTAKTTWIDQYGGFNVSQSNSTVLASFTGNAGTTFTVTMRNTSTANGSSIVTDYTSDGAGATGFAGFRLNAASRSWAFANNIAVQTGATAGGEFMLAGQSGFGSVNDVMRIGSIAGIGGYFLAFGRNIGALTPQGIVTLFANASGKGIIIVGNATSPGNLQEWQDSTLTALARVDSTGKGFFANLAVSAFSSAGVVHNDASGNFTSSLIVNADVDASAAIAFTKIASPLTTKGDILGYSTLSARVPVGSDGQVLTADSAEALGVKWATPSAGGITTLNTLTATTQTFAVGTAGTDFAISSATSTHTFNLPTASASNRGALSSADWSTFNAKQDAGNYITALTGDVTASGPGSVAATIANDAVSNAKLANMATATIKGRTTSGTGDPEDLTASQAAAIVNSSLDHGALTGLSDDDHTQYSLLAGRSGGQTYTGGTAASNNLVLRSTTNATKGQVYVDETTASTSTTTGAFRVGGGAGIAGAAYVGGALQTEGNLRLNGATSGIFIKDGGSGATAGSGTLSSGTATVSTTAVTSESLIFVTIQGDGFSPPATYGIGVSSRSAGTSFTVKTNDASDDRGFAWFIIEPI